ncbi:hypothetical protein GKZ90_0009875 [Flavobacterium sp. MC2016-06]|jgi:uncharacterized membrane protein|nr:hypothetical protein [Flavobacterium sp. MC2016-06]
MEKKKLIYAAIAFILSFAITYYLIKSYKKKDDKNTIENVQVK